MKSQGLPAETPVRLTLRLVALIVGSMLIIASPAWGWHIRDATYRGTHAGGGTVEFDVAPDGKRITRFTATSIRGDVCTISEIEALFPAGSGEIDGHGFNEPPSGASPLGVVGDFQAKRKAQGTLIYDSGSIPSRPRCISEEETWAATTSAPAAGSDECRSAKRLVRRTKKAVRKARRAVRKAASSRAETRAKSRLRKAKRKLKRARKKQKRVC